MSTVPNQNTDPIKRPNNDQAETGECESVEGSQSYFTDTSGRASKTSQEGYNRPRYGRRNPHTQYDFFARERQHQRYANTDYSNRRVPSGDRRDRRDTRRDTRQHQQQWRAHSNDPNANQYGNNPGSQGQPSYNANPPPTFLQAPHLQHLASMQGAYMPPQPPPPPPTTQLPPPLPSHFYPPQYMNYTSGSQEMAGNQWASMWQSGAPARSFATANEERRERGTWEDGERARRMRDQFSQGASEVGGEIKRGRSTNRARKHLADNTGTEIVYTPKAQIASKVQEDECVCGCETIRKKRMNKEHAQSYSYIVIQDSDEKSQPDTEESEYEECTESVSSSEEEGECDGKTDNEGLMKTTHPRIPGAVFGTHSLCDSAKVVDITGRVRQAACGPMGATEKVLEIQGGGLAAKENVTLPDPIQLISDPVQPITEVFPQSSMSLDDTGIDDNQPDIGPQSATDSSNHGKKVTVCVQVHADAEPQIGPEASHTEQVASENTQPGPADSTPCELTSEREGQSQPELNIADQSLERLAAQILKANERAANREGEIDRVEHDAKVTRDEQESGSTPAARRVAKQTLLSPTGQLISAQVTDDSEVSENTKLKTDKQTGKKKKTKTKKKGTNSIAKKDDSQDETKGPNTRSKNQGNPN